MLPFLKNKVRAQTGVMIKERAPDTSDKEETDYPEAALEACASDLIEAVHARDVAKVAQVLKDAFELCDIQPHEEGPHIEPESENE